MARVPLLTESLFARLVAGSVGRAQSIEDAHTDQDLADLIGCSAATVGNARNVKGKLQGHTLFNLLAVHPHALEGLLHHFGRRSVPIEAKCDTDELVSTAGAVHKLAAVKCPKSPGGATITDGELLSIMPELEAAQEAIAGLLARAARIAA